MLKKIQNYLISALIFFPAFAWSQVNRNGDFQIWDRTFFLKHLNKQWLSYSFIEFRFGDNASELYQYFIHTQMIYRPLPFLSIGPGYRQIWQKILTTGKWQTGESPLLDLAFVYRFKGWELRDRNRVQYVIFPHNPSHWWYRNRMRFVTPSFFETRNIAFFLDNEFFWRQTLGVNEDRLSAGFMFEMLKHLAGELFYMARFLKVDPHWNYMTILNIALVFSF